jgi:hypothetical protein
MKKIYVLTATTLVLALAGCATSQVTPSTLTADNSPTAVDVMRNGGTYKFVKPTEPIYANSSAELAKRYVGRHIDELPEATSATKAVQDPNEVVCKVVKRTHTRLRAKTICAPKKEWDLYKTQAQDTMRQKQITRFSGD